jgi:indole-3-glycerol phosphate synthase
MNDILEKIRAAKIEEVARARQMRSEAELRREAQARQDVRGFTQAIEDKIATGKPSIIAEIKKVSLPPSGGLVEDFSPQAIAANHAVQGATCLSVLTDVQFFQGSHDSLRQARAACPLPVLRKDFIIDRYQIIFSRALGADCVLLIAAALAPGQLKELADYAFELGMDVLIEVCNPAELELAQQLNTPLLGINHDGLWSPHSFPTAQEKYCTTLDLLANVHTKQRVILESSRLSPQDIGIMRQHGVDAFLIGETLMTTLKTFTCQSP